MQAARHDWVEYANAMSTIVVALIAGIELWKARSERRRRERLARARLISRTDRVQRVVHEWVISHNAGAFAKRALPPEAASALVSKNAAWRKRVLLQAESAELLMSQLLDEVLDAPPAVADEVHKAADAFALGVEATRDLEHHAVKYQPRSADEPDRWTFLDTMVDTYDRNAAFHFRASAEAIDEARALAHLSGLWWRQPLARLMPGVYDALEDREVTKQMEVRDEATR